ncbi:MAG: putative lipid II flippase FtsW [Deltaproteobacteria bacterium]|nr:putative lipid II flippase FtsW [Deltaproteobacteria bacterium]
MEERQKVDPVLFFAVLSLVALGVVMVYSASAVFVESKTGDSLYYLKRQLINVALGLAVMLGAMRVGYQRLVRWAYPLLLGVVVLLVLVLIPGVAVRAGGSSRWLPLGVMNFQPGELAKIAFVLYLACSLTRKKDRIQAFSVGFLPHLLVCGVLLLLLLGQPDFGTAATLTLILFFMLFVAGTRVTYIAVAGLAALPMAYGLIVGSEYRMRRLLAFLDPWAHRFDIGYQISESLMSFGSGGLWGTGLGEGKHKLFFLPAAHTDFIFSQVGEELGFVGAVAVLALFAVVVWRGFRAALRSPDLFGTYLAFGLAALIALQTLVNVGVVTGVLPTKGLTLPFMSYGGSSLLCTLLAMGILMDISAAGGEKADPGGSKVTWP